MKTTLLLIYLLVHIAACASTQKAWSKFEPSEYVFVQTNGVDPEPILKKNKVNYYCTKVDYSSDNLKKACYVEKTLAQKTNEFNRSLEKTPEALVKDLVVIGKVTIEALITVGVLR